MAEMKYTLTLTLTIGLTLTFYTNQENTVVMKYVLTLTLTLTLGLTLTFCTNQEKYGCNEIHTNPNPNLNPRFNPNLLNKSRKIRL